MGFETRGRLAVISGGSMGLGRSLAAELVRGGADVVIVARNADRLRKAAKALEELAGPDQKVSFIAADCAEPSECDRVFREIERSPDIVICAAGGATPGLFVDTETAVLKKNLSIVYDTALYFSHSAVRAMVKADPTHERHLVYCSSVLAVFPFIGYSSYGPAKAAIRALADIVRQECIPYNITVTNILPGNMATEGFEEEEKTKPEITKKIEGPSDARDPDVVAKEVIADLKRGRQMIFTDFVGWLLSGMALGTSPRNWGVVQALVALVLGIFAPVWAFFMRRDIKNYFNTHPPTGKSVYNSPTSAPGSSETPKTK